MWLMGCPNPCKLEQQLECNFLKPFIQVKTKWASKKFSIYAIQSYQLHSKADSAHQGWIGLTAWLVTLNGIGEKFFWCSSWFYMGKRFQKNALPFLFQFARVRAAHQLHVLRLRIVLERNIAPFFGWDVSDLDFEKTQIVRQILAPHSGWVVSNLDI